MKKKLIKILTFVLAIAFAAGCFAGCGAIITTDNQKDMTQIVAEVNIGKDKDELKRVFTEVLPEGEALKLTDEQIDKAVGTTEVSKLDLVSYFINYGYNYVSQGYSYSQVFEMLINSLTARKMILQFATLYFLNEGKVEVGEKDVLEPDNVTEDGTVIIKEIDVTEYLAAVQKGEDDALTYLLSDDNYKFALYTLRKSINNAIDSYEKQILKITDDSSSSSTTARTLPTGATEENSNFYPKTESGEVDYQIYTGYNSADVCGEYEALEKSNVVTRKQAYNKFIVALERNYMLGDDDDITKIEELPYFKTEMKSQMEQAVINNFSNTLLIAMSRTVGEQDLTDKYNEIFEGQQTIFTQTSEFTSALDKVSDNSFVLYAPKSGFGFVYNILLPFSAAQSSELTHYQNTYSNYASNPYYLTARNRILKEVRGFDQRESWFTGETDYSYQAEEGKYYNNGKNSDYLFFKDNKDGIDKYAGQYPYNGEVTKEKDDTYTFRPNRVTIDEFITEMEGYLNFILGTSSVEVTKPANDNFYNEKDFGLTTGTEVNYEDLVYYTAKVNGVAEIGKDNYLVKENASYKALSAMNDLMFAYSTDTGCLNKYLGYSVAGTGNSTSYVKEFEYAALKALEQGEGTISVVATDFGWHIIYVTYVYGAGETYSSFNYGERNAEGTFSNFFYNAYKSVIANNYATEKTNNVTTVLREDSVTVYANRYKDLSNLDLQQ